MRAASDPPPDPYALSKRLGEEACRLHPAPATVVRLTSVFGPGQVAWEGATGAIAAFAARALDGRADRDPRRPAAHARLRLRRRRRAGARADRRERRWNETFTLGERHRRRRSCEAAELVREAAGSGFADRDARRGTAAGENESYETDRRAGLDFEARPLEEAVQLYVDWLRRHPAAQGRTRA